MLWVYFVASDATTDSKHPWRSDLTSDLKSVTLITRKFLCLLVLCFGPTTTTTASKQPCRSDLTSDLEFNESIAQTSYDTNFALVVVVSDHLIWKKRKKLDKIPLLDLSASPQVKTPFLSACNIEN